jgi:hypothetical protein
MKQYGHSQVFVADSSQDERVARLNSYRNDFIHYVPASSLLDMRDWAQLVLDIVPIIQFLVFKSNNVTLHRQNASAHISGLCKVALSEASGLLDFYGA